MIHLAALLCLSPGILDRALMGVLLAKDVPPHTHAYLACPSTRWLTHADARRYKCQGSVARPEFSPQWLWCDTSRCLCHCEPWEKLQRSRTLGQRVMLLLKQGVFPAVRLSHACGHAQRNSQHSLPSSSRGCQKYWIPVATHSHTPRIHTVNRKIAFFLCLTRYL